MAAVAAATAMIAALQGMGAVTAQASDPDDPPPSGGITICVLFCNGGSDIPDYTEHHNTQNNQNNNPPYVAALDGTRIGPLELGANLIQAIGVEETNPNGTEPKAVRSGLGTVVGIPASLPTVHQAITVNALTALKLNEALRRNVDASQPFRDRALTKVEVSKAEDRAKAVARLLKLIREVPALTDAQIDKIAVSPRLLTSAGVSADNVRTMFRAVGLKKTIDAAHDRVKSKIRTPAEKAALDAEVALILPADRLGIGEGSLRAYIRNPANWGENKASWERLAVLNLPNNLGKRIEAFATANEGYAIASVNVTKWLNDAYAAAGCTIASGTCPQLTERDLVITVAKRQNARADYPDKVLAQYCRLFRNGCPSGGSNLTADADADAEEVNPEDEGPVAGLTVREAPRTTPLFTWSNPVWQDSSTSGTEDGDAVNLDAESSFVRIEAMGLTSQEAGTVPLFQYWNGDRQDYFATATPDGIAAANASGYTLVRTEAYVFTEQVEGTVPLFQLWNPARGDALLAATQTGVEDARLAGYVQVRVEGYVFPVDAEAFPPGPPPPVGPVHVADDLPNLSTPTVVYGPDQSVSVFGSPGSVDGPVAAVVFVRGSDGALMFSRRGVTGNTYAEPLNLGGGTVGDPAALMTDAGKIEVFIRGTDDEIYANIVTAANDVLGFSKVPGGLLASSEPEVVQLPFEAPGNIRMLVRGRDGAVWSNIRRAGAWEGWKSFGGYITSELNAGRLGTAGGIFLTSDIALVARAATGRVLLATITGDDRVTWQTLGDLRATSNITFAGSRVSTQLFARGEGGGAWTFDLSTHQTQWTQIGGTITSDVAATAGGIFVRGTDNAIYVNPALFLSFLGYARLDGAATGNPAAYSPAFNEQTGSNSVPSQTLLVRDANGQLVKNEQLPVTGNQTFAGYRPLVNPPPPPPPPAPPGNCTTNAASRTASSMCTTGAGTHRVVVTVVIVDRTGQSTTSTYVGPWVAVGQTSTVSWPTGPPEVRVETRS
jgi:hypothetical protein